MTQKITILCVGSLKERTGATLRQNTQSDSGALQRLSLWKWQKKKLPANAGASDEQIVVEAESRLLAGKNCPFALYARRCAGHRRKADDVSGFRILALDRASYGKTDIVFLIGGSLGLSEELLRQADVCISFSSMTFPHQLMRVILLEQLYRAMKINRNEPYHK